MPILGDINFPASGGNRTRSQVQAGLADFLGGANKSDVKALADRCWEDAVREFNAVPWAFTRVIDDIIIDSSMKANVDVPSVASTGVGLGFTLETGRAVTYWVEERIKDGNRVLQRNDTESAGAGTVKKVVLTGTGVNVKPVITRPAQVNPDATHWALYATPTTHAHDSTIGAYPKGFLIGEAAIATTGIEDTRTGINPGIPANSEIYESGEYDLSAPFRSPVRALMVDGDGQTRYSLTFIPWRRWTVYRPWQITTSSSPIWYTMRNWYRNGRVSFDPRPGPATTYPIVRVAYNQPIVLPEGADAQLDVPVEMDQLIFQRATLIARRRHIGPDSVSMSELNEWTQQFYELEVQWRDHPDF